MNVPRRSFLGSLWAGLSIVIWGRDAPPPPPEPVAFKIDPKPLQDIADAQTTSGEHLADAARYAMTPRWLGEFIAWNGGRHFLAVVDRAVRRADYVRYDSSSLCMVKCENPIDGQFISLQDAELAGKDWYAFVCTLPPRLPDEP